MSRETNTLVPLPFGPFIIGFAGRAGAGKDTAAKALNGLAFADPMHLGHFAFANRIKAIAKDLYQLTEAQLYGDLKEVIDPRWGVSPRYIMQRLGTEVARSIHPDTWVRALLDRDIPASKVQIAVISDVRFPNEVAAIHVRGGVVIRIDRPFLSALDPTASQHESEAHAMALDVDASISNGATLGALAVQVHQTVERLGRERGR